MAAAVGGTIGGAVPALWGGSILLSFSSVIFSALGAIAGIYIAFKFSD